MTLLFTGVNNLETNNDKSLKKNTRLSNNYGVMIFSKNLRLPNAMSKRVIPSH